MTEVGPAERDTSGGAEGRAPGRGGFRGFEDTDGFEAAVEALSDPLSDPLPPAGGDAGERPPLPRRGKAAHGRRRGGARHAAAEPTHAVSAWFRPHTPPEAGSGQRADTSAGLGEAVAGRREGTGDAVQPPPAAGGAPRPDSGAARYAAYRQTAPRSPAPGLVHEPPEQAVTWGTGQADAAPPGAWEAPERDATTRMPPVVEQPAPRRRVTPRHDSTVTLRVGALRDAVTTRLRVLAGVDGLPAVAAEGDGDAPAGSRVAARRARREAKAQRAVMASRIAGEAFITIGVLMLLFVTYQLWWTNVLAHRQAGGEAAKLRKEWSHGDDGRKAGAFEPGQGFAIMYIPRLDVKAPVAQGISKHKVLDRGMIGHYDSGPLKTAMPWDKKGNFAVAGHRNTHGEPFRYINRLEPGDPVVVETKDTYFVYKITSTLPSTSPSNTTVLKPVPRGSGFTRPGRYLTLTTCTPEFTSKYRLIVWGKMVEERPRAKGKPDALVG